MAVGLFVAARYNCSMVATDDELSEFVYEHNIGWLAITSKKTMRYTANLFANRNQ